MVFYVIYNFGVEKLIRNTCKGLKSIPKNMSIIISEEVI